MNVHPALLSALIASESSRCGPRIVPQLDRRQQEVRRTDWRGGRRVSDFSRFASPVGTGSPPMKASERPQATAEGLLH
jgi:hypothetical protein